MIQTHTGVFFFSKEEVINILVKAILEEHVMVGIDLSSAKLNVNKRGDGTFISIVFGVESPVCITALETDD